MINISKTPNQSKRRLIVFDVEGVLIPKKRYLFEASSLLSFKSFLRILWAGLLYEVGIVSIEVTLKRVFKELAGVALNDLYKHYKKIPLMPGVKEVFKDLEKSGHRIAFISSGIPQVFVEDLAAQLGADYAFGLQVEVSKGLLTGRITGDAIKHHGKALILKSIMEKEHLTPHDCILVVDDRNNLPMFEFCKFKIGFNPDFLLSAKADIVVHGDLSHILSLIREKIPTSKQQNSISKRELTRESIHLAGFLVPFLAMYTNTTLMAFLIFLVTGCYIISEFARLRGFNIPIASTITWNAANTTEVHEFITAPIFYATGIMLALIFFPPNIGYAAIAILALGDGSASLLGKSLGKMAIPLNKGKKIEGSVIGFFFALAGALFFVSPLRALLGSAVGMIVESLPSPINDNLIIPLSTALVLLIVP